MATHHTIGLRKGKGAPMVWSQSIVELLKDTLLLDQLALWFRENAGPFPSLFFGILGVQGLPLQNAQGQLLNPVAHVEFGMTCDLLTLPRCMH